jgi:hypothetical protein
MTAVSLLYCNPGRTTRFQLTDGMRTRIEQSQSRCNDLQTKFDRRITLGAKEKIYDVGT